MRRYDWLVLACLFLVAAILIWQLGSPYRTLIKGGFVAAFVLYVAARRWSLRRRG